VALSIEIGSYLRKYVPGYDPTAGVELKFQPGMTVRDVVARLGIPAAEASVVTVNRAAATVDQELKDGDLVGIFPVAMGG
jgi:sulfur carrier protein ThiS